MSYYIVQVKTGCELTFVKAGNQKLDTERAELFFLQRKLFIRKKGKKHEQNTAMFPGYIVFKTADTLISPYDAVLIRKIDGFVRFLKSTAEPTACYGADLEILQHFMSFGGTINASKVYFDEHDRIVITEGPLKGLEGSIRKIDKRKGRAKIHLDLYDESFLIDLAFEIINKKQEQPTE